MVVYCVKKCDILSLPKKHNNETDQSFALGLESFVMITFIARDITN